MDGTVKFFNAMKNFGFISGSDGKDYFVHSSALKEGTRLNEGDKVTFEPTQGDKGIKAEKVEKV
jgi:CspA family cold shock protein